MQPGAGIVEMEVGDREFGHPYHPIGRGVQGGQPRQPGHAQPQHRPRHNTAMFGPRRGVRQHWQPVSEPFRLSPEGGHLARRKRRGRQQRHGDLR